MTHTVVVHYSFEHVVKKVSLKPSLLKNLIIQRGLLFKHNRGKFSGRKNDELSKAFSKFREIFTGCGLCLESVFLSFIHMCQGYGQQLSMSENNLKCL